MVQGAVLRYAEVNSPLFEPFIASHTRQRFQASLANFRLAAPFLANFFRALIFWFFCIKTKEHECEVRHTDSFATF